MRRRSDPATTWLRAWLTPSRIRDREGGQVRPGAPHGIAWPAVATALAHFLPRGAAKNSNFFVSARKHQPVPVAACARAGQSYFPSAPRHVWSAMRHSRGSVAFDASGRYVCAISPRGNIATVWDVQRASFVRSLIMTDVCGVARTAIPEQFLLAGAYGKMCISGPRDSRKLQCAATAQ
ncbi:MAG: DUF1513 domain-containing protein [Gammaproteobacteria bacterium]|nr:DUF1513 domain-containing protein [Gammaproteobacteria bacterium]